MTASYADGHVTFSWGNVHSVSGDRLGIFVDGQTQPYWTANYTIRESGTDTEGVGLSTCSGDHTIDVKIATCFQYYDIAPWAAKATVAVPNPADPTVSIKIKPNNGTYVGSVTYQFPSTGSRTLTVVRKAKPPYSLIDTVVVQPYSPPDLANTVPFIPDSTSGDEIYEATATSGACNPAHEAKDHASLDNTKCCPWQPPNGGNGGPPPIGISAAGSFGHPVRLTTGNMHYTDSEPLPQPLVALTRTYDSANATVGAFGKGWTSIFDAGVVVTGTGNDQSVVINTEENKRYVWFVKNAAFHQTWPKDAETPAILGSAGVFSLREPGADMVRTFNSSGRLSQLTSLRQQRSLLISYGANGRPTQVTDSWGDVTLLVTTDPTSHLITRIEVSGRPDIFWTYQYSSNLLVAVVAPDSHQWRQYQYTAGLLSTILDPLGNLIESHSYDATGRATSSIQATSDITSAQYGLPGRNPDETLTTITYASGKVSNYYSRSEGSSVLTADVFGGCSACSSENGTYVYDSMGHVTRSQDARGYVTDVVYAGGVLSTIRGPLKPSSCDPQTDSNHCRMTVEDLAAAAVVATPVTLTTNYVYGDGNWPDRPTSITIDSVANPGGTRLVTLTYDATSGQVLTRTETGWISATQSESHTTTTTLYNGTEGAAFEAGGPFNSSWLTLSQPRGLQKVIDGPRADVSDVTTFVYYPIDASVTATWRGRLAAVRDALGHITTYSDYDVFGNAQTVIDPNGVNMTTTYDPLGRLLTTKYPAIVGCDTTADPTCNTDIIASRSYSAGGGPLATETKPRGGVTTYTYDSRGRISSLTRTVSSTVSERIEYDYDPTTGQKSAERFLDNSTGTYVTKKSTSFLYDEESRLAQMTYPDGAKVVYTYDVAGALASTQDENHTTANTTYTYDPKGAVSRVAQVLGTGQINTSYAYDPQGNLVSVTDPNGNVTTYSYDDLGRMAKQVSPVTGTTTYSYDLADNSRTMTDANGATTTRAFDELNRVTSATSVRSGVADETLTWTYDDTTPGIYGIGRLTASSSNDWSGTYTYSRRGQLLSQADGEFLTAYTYDADGDRDSIAYPSGRFVSYAYDLAGRPVSATADGAAVVTSATYLPFGPSVQVGLGNSTTKATSFDARYRVVENKLTLGVTTIADYTYADDSVGNITQIHDVVDSTYNRDFDYDDLNRLIVANSGASLWGAGSYTYDASGNVTSIHLGNRSLTFSYLSSTSLLQSVSGTNPEVVTHDAAGNETSSAAYTSRNLVATVGTPLPGNESTWTEFGYDSRGLRNGAAQHRPDIVHPLRRTYFYTPELHLLSQTDWAGLGLLGFVVGTDYIWFGDEPVAQLPANRDGDAAYTFTDHLGTPVLQTDPAGSIVWRAEYEPFGRVYAYRVPDASDRQTLRLPGQEEDYADLGLTYNIFRWYRAGWGRYTQADPIGVDGGENLFAYVGGAPTRFFDRWGLYRRGDVIYRCPPSGQSGACDVVMVWDDPTPSDDTNGDESILAYGPDRNRCQRCPVGIPPTIVRRDSPNDPYAQYRTTGVFRPWLRHSNDYYQNRLANWPGGTWEQYPPRQCYNLANWMGGDDPDATASQPGPGFPWLHVVDRNLPWWRLRANGSPRN